MLLLQVPRTNDKKELAAEQMFASLHGLLQAASTSRFKILESDRISFEIAVKGKRIGFYVWVPNHLKGFVEEQVYAQYPTVQISEVSDYTEGDLDNSHYAVEMKLTGNEALPIKTFPSFEVDPLAAITATLAQFSEDEEAWIQVVVRPASEGWYKKSERFSAHLRGQAPGRSTLVRAVMSADTKPASAPKLAEFETTQASAAEEKSHKLAYEVALRIVYKGNDDIQARMRLQAISASLKQFNTTYLNGFAQKSLGSDHSSIEQFRTRSIGRSGFVLNIEEIASLYHLPHTNVETPNILWANAKTAEPPANLPIVTESMAPELRAEISPIAVTNFRGQNAMFGLLRQDRSRHLYILGQTGVGKSGLLELLTISDIYSPYGFAVIDPHGDYAVSTLKRIPEARVKDVVYFNPADTDFPIAFNPMEVNDPKLKTHTCSELIGVLKRMFESWGPRLEYILRYSILALLDYPNATMLDITRILTDERFRKKVIEHLTDPVVRNFWTVEFASWNSRFATEAVAPVLNKVGAFTANPVVRNIIGQPNSSFNIRKIMDERKILIVNLSRGLIGEDNAALLGALLVTKIQLAAMSRADIDNINDRIPFYLYVDEFQNFATDSFTTILSEARKYSLILTVANQYIAQMPQTVKDAVFGNVGSIISFRMSADDSRTMVRYFEPHFSDFDLIHMHNRNFAVNMTIDGEKVQAFSGTTINLPPKTVDFSQQIIESSRSSYAFNKSDIEVVMHERYQTNQTRQPESSAQNKAAPAVPPTPAPSATTANQGREPEPEPAVNVLAGVAETTELSPKPKRRRRRKHASNTNPSPTPATPHSPSDMGEDRIINLR